MTNENNYKGEDSDESSCTPKRGNSGMSRMCDVIENGEQFLHSNVCTTVECVNEEWQGASPCFY